MTSINYVGRYGNRSFLFQQVRSYVFTVLLEFEALLLIHNLDLTRRITFSWNVYISFLIHLWLSIFIVITTIHPSLGSFLVSKITVLELFFNYKISNLIVQGISVNWKILLFTVVIRKTWMCKKKDVSRKPRPIKGSVASSDNVSLILRAAWSLRHGGSFKNVFPQIGLLMRGKKLWPGRIKDTCGWSRKKYVRGGKLILSRKNRINP